MRPLMLVGAIVLLVADLVVGGPVAKGGPLLVLVVAALLLELGAVPLAGFGHFSAASACYLAAGLHPEVGPAGAAVLVVLGTLVRLLGAPGPRPLDSALVATLPVLAAVLAPALWVGLAPRGLPAPFAAVPALLAVTVYLALERAVPRQLARGTLRQDRVPWMRLRRSLGELHLVVALTGAGAAYLSPWPALLVPLPLLWACHRAAENTLFRVQAVAAQEAREELAELQETVDHVQSEADRVKRQLDLTREQKERLEEFARHLSRSPGLRETLDLAVETVAREVECRTVAVFLSADGKRSSLHPAGFRSPAQERLREAELLGQREPLVDAAWTAARPLALSAETDRPDRLLAGEKVAVALPLRREGVLYVGRDEHTFAQGELERLLWLAEKLALALATARQHEDVQQALVRGERERGHLRGQVALLSALVDGSRGLASSLDIEELVKSSREFLQRVVPHQAGLVDWGGRVRTWGKPPDRLARLSTTVLGDRPLLLPELAESHPQSGLPGSVIAAAPLLLYREQPFSETELELVSLHSYQLDLALSRAFQHARLAESQAQLVESSKLKAVGQLAAGVAHELNSPLGAIRLALDSTMALSLEPPSARPRLEKAASACRRAQGIVESLLVYARGGSARTEVFPLSQVVTDTLAFLQGMIATQGFQLTTRLESSDQVSGSCAELQQVLINLVLNAMDAARDLPDERRRLELGCRREEAEAILWVRDFGPGVPDDVRERLFEPFFTTKPVGRGTGLGLSISREIAERHQGRLEVESVPGEGATFTLRLPAR